MRSVLSFSLPVLVALSGVLSGPLVSPPRASAHDGDAYDDGYRDFDDDNDDAIGSEATYRYFRDELAPYGEWLQVPTYGWAWRPRDVGPDWQPYTVGRWIDTDYGWTWVSDERWGRSPYHYGRWYWDRRYGGWVWIPGRRWAPAWVDWREGDRYWGWAPLPPTATWRPGAGFTTRTFNVEPQRYCFVEKRFIAEPNIHHYIAPPAQNVTIIHKTTDVTNYTIVNHRVANHAVREATVEKAIGHQVPRYPVAEVESAAPRAFHRPEAHEAPARNVEPHEPRRGVEARSTAPLPAEGTGRVQVDRDRADPAARERAARLKAERERQDTESRERARLDRERSDRDRKGVERSQDAERQREAARQADVERQREAERRHDLEARDQQARQREAARQADVERQREAARRHDLEARDQQAREREAREHEARQRDESARSREMARQQAAQRQEAARAAERTRAERGKAEQEAARQQAEAERRRAPRPHPQPQQQQPQQQP